MTEFQDHHSPNFEAGLSRRNLFRRAGFAAGGALFLGLPNFLSAFATTAEAAVSRAGSPLANTAIELDGLFAGSLLRVEGGGVFAEVVPEAVSPDMVQRKRPGPVRFEDIVVEIALGSIDKPLSSWIIDSLTKSFIPKNGAIVYADLAGNQLKRLEFTGAVLSEVLVSDCDAADNKQFASLTLRLVPQSTQLTGGKGKLSAPMGLKAKQAVNSNFRFNVQGLEQSSPGIMKVEGIGAQRALAGSSISQDKFRQPLAPGALDCSLVRILLREADAGPFYAWFEDMVINNKPGAERAGLLEWLDPMMKTVLGSIQLGNLGIVRYQPAPTHNGNEQKLGMVEVDMYCETLKLSI